ncbi:MAG: ABC transporter ATP-binding protein [Deinococcales bacterium]
MQQVEAVVEVDSLVKRYGDVHAVDGVSFTVARGEFFGMLGPNGAGKSTLMRMIYQVTPRTSGSLRVLGMPAGERARSIKQRLGVVPQLDNLDEELRVVDNLLIYARFNGIRGVAARRRADELLTFADLNDKRKAMVDELSGGMKRRLMLVRGLMNDPELVVLDEPTTGLDPQVRLNLWNKLEELRTQGKTLLMSTHYMDEAERLCDRLVIMDHGKIIASGAPQALIRENLPPFVIEARAGAGEGEHLAGAAQGLGLGAVRSGDRVSVFVSDADAALARLREQGWRLERAFVRPANLEDVFLKLTGRALRE